MNPYYQDKYATIFLGDCLDLLPDMPKVDLVLTDPPYGDCHSLHENGKYKLTKIDFLNDRSCKQFVFWSPKILFPLNYSAIHIWDKKTGVQSEYEIIYERNGQDSRFRMFRYYLINSTVAASYARDIFVDHPAQKPIRLIENLLKISEAETILDPFGGSCTTAVAAKQLNLKCTIIEIEEKFCEIGAKRLSQEVLDLA